MELLVDMSIKLFVFGGREVWKIIENNLELSMKI
jgi:hypothetical protein